MNFLVVPSALWFSSAEWPQNHDLYFFQPNQNQKILSASVLQLQMVVQTIELEKVKCCMACETYLNEGLGKLST